MASALVHLTEKKIIHHNIKPANITYSPPRGAVLLDFGMLYDVSSMVKAGGTPWYLPPEFLNIDVEKRYCGFPGDIWALGVTILYLLGKCRPEKTKNWRIRKVHEYSPDRMRMESWIRLVAKYRKQLKQADDGIGRLVSQMLHDNVNLRIKAAELQAKVLAVKGLAK
ncbi:kinase-like domain-containing protein [Trichoderma velutinum]